MSSIYRRALGSEFGKLHPEIQRRFSLTAEAGVASVGRGRMERLWHGKAYTLPFLYVGTWRSIMFPEQGRDVPFTIENYAYRDGGLRIRSGEQRFYEGPVGFRFPLLLSGVAEVCEWYDDAAQCFRISVSAENRRWGRLFGYEGSFQCDWLKVQPGEVPVEILPRRVEARE